jgi:hypothetical protein
MRGSLLGMREKPETIKEDFFPCKKYLKIDPE